jgi:lysine 2,3-aminomutase
MYCRFCTRKRATMKRGGWDAVSRDDERMVEYVREHPEIRDVIVSGGDPLTLPLEKLAFFLENLAAIDHVDVIRVGTRVPVTLPQRIDDDELIAVLSASDKVWIQTHFNHAREVTPEAARAARRLRMAGLPINNHAVLMRGVNDTLAAQRDLCRALLRIKVRPYYLFHCDPVTGAGHFRTSVWTGIEIIEGLRGHLSGLGIPTYVVDATRGGGKIPLGPNYLVSAADDAVVLRNYEGMLVRYSPQGQSHARPPVATQGVSALLESQAEALVPEGNPRHKRRKPLPPLLDPANIKPARQNGANGKHRTNGTNGHDHEGLAS